MSRKTFQNLLRAVVYLLIGALLLFGGSCLTAELFARSRLYSAEDIPASRIAIVFGAGLQRNGTPSPILRDRVEMAAHLYSAGKVDKLLMSGDNRFLDYNEPGAMRDYAVRLGVPKSDIVLDYAGRRTYDTCYRARHIFNVSEAILITQRYHLPRALITCSNLGVQSTGVPSDLRHYRRSSYAIWYAREIPATTVALWQVWVTRPLPVLGKPEPIFTKNSFLQSFLLAPIPQETRKD